ncbi:ribonuclease HI family protein [Arthrobacter mobilis]|uniref:Ribonuclease H n=1 Tax=Arthrobacter mobilis TaxID=2724944 RepID=A0A7X6HHL4_9MICC|nr:ribonuclease HI family protein [Arthrobacter mobilis]NKX56226.1 ribonuclease HI family protein [Arthrobacter mobilis]
MTITAAADGSALGNPGPAGWAWYIDDDCWAAGGWPHGTNNQGELMAVLDLLRSTAHLPGEHLRILCDSQYVINCITKWMPGWKRKGWRKADGRPVLNVDLLQQIDEAVKGRSYEFEWVRGHTGHDLNEAADLRARAVAVAYQQGTTAPTGPGFTHRPGAEARPADTAAEEPVPAAPATGTRRPEPAAAAGGAAEPDLFSELEDLDRPVDEGRPEHLVLALEEELLRPETRTDFGRMAVLLHPEFAEIGESGRMWTREDIINALRPDPAADSELDLLGVERLGEESILLTYRSRGRTGSSLRSSLWLRDAGRWRLRFHQGTPERG